MLVLVGLIFASSLGNLEKVLPTLSVVAISLLRLIPAFNSLNANYNYLRLYNVSINLIINELKKQNKNMHQQKFKEETFKQKIKILLKLMI